jgi:hypothetical protein
VKNGENTWLAFQVRDISGNGVTLDLDYKITPESGEVPPGGEVTIEFELIPYRNMSTPFYHFPQRTWFAIDNDWTELGFNIMTELEICSSATGLYDERVNHLFIIKTAAANADLVDDEDYSVSEGTRSMSEGTEGPFRSHVLVAKADKSYLIL